MVAPMKLRCTLLIFASVVMFSTRLWAQAPVVGHPDPESLFTDSDPRLHANKQVVLHIVRDLLEANHWQDAGKYLTNEYIQHNPNVASGLAPVVKFFGSRKPGPIPDRKSWRTQVVAVLAEDDLVVVAFRRELPDPRAPASKKTYTTTWFDMWRIKDGKADEHWDYGTIAPPAAPNPPASPKSIQ
jgi:predicted SnoaL-like aldol condensation-catalyzing enzyme